MVFYMFFKKFPFTNPEWDEQKNFEAILTHPLEFPEDRAMPSVAGREFMRSVLEKDPSARLGAMEDGRLGWHQIKAHDWFDCDFLDIFLNTK